MFGSDAIEVGIGMALLFVFASLTATAAREMIEALVKSRAADLERGIIELLSAKGTASGSGSPTGPSTLVADFYSHPMIFSLFGGDYKSRQKNLELTSALSWFWTIGRVLFGMKGGNLPSYIPAKNFSAALLDIVARGRDPTNATDARNGATLTVDDLRESVGKIENVGVQRAILSALDTSQGSIEQARRSIESWFDGTMDRVSGWYKRRTQFMLFVIGLVVAVGVNIDAVHVYRELNNSKSLRQAVVAQAAKVDVSQPPSNGMKSIADLSLEYKTIGYPIGWPAPQLNVCAPTAGKTTCVDQPLTWSLIWAAIPGWLITALAVTLGAPFWFDVLNKFMVIRSTVKPAEKSQEEGSEDRLATPVAPGPVTRMPEREAPLPSARPPDGTASVALAAGLLASYPFEPRVWDTTGDRQEGLA